MELPLPRAASRAFETQVEECATEDDDAGECEQDQDEEV